ncbi:hypothetical protein BDZ97DRAFT_1839242 [Flammula alnicola]|nr:hypothetical protein BDZ97DRAFT_1839242 [Flammula alnicola]
MEAQAISNSDHEEPNTLLHLGNTTPTSGSVDLIVDDDDPSLGHLSAHPDLWFDDGSLVLQASNVGFRVHRTILCKLSEVFRDMMMIPQAPGEDSDTFEGCPLVKLPDDVTDLTQLLKSIYEPTYFDDLSSTIQDENFVLGNISGVLRLTTKYRFKALRQKAIRILKEINPTDMDRFVVRFTKLLDSRSRNREEQKIATAEEIISLSIACNARTLLPGAFYRLCQILGTDGSRDHLLLGSSNISDLDKAWCLSGRTRISAQVANSGAYLISDSNTPRCNLPEATTRSQRCRGRPPRKDPRFTFEDVVWTSTEGACHKCMSLYEKQHRCRRQEIWDLLPQYFGLGKSWEEMRRNDANWE